jgi:hypothetical protein
MLSTTIILLLVMFQDKPKGITEFAIAAIAGVLGFLGKWAFDEFKESRKKKEGDKDALLALQILLTDSGTTFHNQNYQARRLMKLLRRNHPDETANLQGFDDTFKALHPKFNAEERELQQLIRNTTMTSMRHLNEQLKKWLDENKRFRNRNQKDDLMKKFAASLDELAEHLNLWESKYARMDKDEAYSLIYMADERMDGKRFPPELTPVLEQVIRARRYDS